MCDKMKPVRKWHGTQSQTFQMAFAFFQLLLPLIWLLEVT